MAIFKKIIGIIGLCLFSLACEDEIPATKYGYEVRCSVDLRFFPLLAGANSSVRLIPGNFPAGFIPGPLDRFGYGGVLLYNVDGFQILAYDLACPVEYNNGIRVVPEDDIATCPECGHKFSLTSGVCITGKFPPLARYVVRQDAFGTYYVSNY